MDKGWVSLHRKLLDKGFAKKPEYLAIWIYLLLNANHSDKEYLYNNNIIMIKRGQLLTTKLGISEHFNISRSKVIRILKHFEIEQQIEQRINNHYTLISITNYDSYQINGQQNEQPVNNQRTTSEQPVNTNNNNNNKNNVNNEIKKTAGKPSAPDFINELITLFSKCFLKARGIDYESATPGKDRNGMAKLLTIYKKKNKSDTAKTKADFEDFFTKALKIPDEWHFAKMSPMHLASNLTEIKTLINNPKGNQYAKRSLRTTSNITADYFELPPELDNGKAPKLPRTDGGANTTMGT